MIEMQEYTVPITNILAEATVSDFSAALVWYERLLGRPVDRLPMDNLAVWQITETGGIQVWRDTDRAGKALLTIIDGPQRTADQVDPHLWDVVREMSLTALPNASMKEQPLEPSAPGRLNEIDVPTLVMVGDLDDDSIKTISDSLEVGIIGSQKVVIPKAAHLPSLEQPEKFNRAVLEFYAQANGSEP